MEVPELSVGHVETPSPYTPHGVKGGGEGGRMMAPAAINAAVNDALAPTHVDSFSHLDPDPTAQTIEQMPLDLFYGTAVCLDVTGVPVAACPRRYPADVAGGPARSRRRARP
jgi:Putative cyclase